MGKVHVWLVEDGGPQSADELQPFLRRRLSDPDRLRLPWWLGFLRGLVLWWRCRSSHKRLVGPCAEIGRAPELDSVQALAVEVQHALGGRYSVQSVFRHGDRGVAAAAAMLEKGASVVVLDLAPDGAMQLRPDLKAALDRRGARVVVAGPWLGAQAWLRLRVRGIRAAVARLVSKDGHLPDHELVFAIRSASDERVESAASALRKALGRDRPVRLAHVPDLEGKARGRTPMETLDEIAQSGSKPVIVVPIGFGSTHLEAALALGARLRARAEALGLTPYIEVPPPASEQEAGLMLAEVVQAAERAADWPVPEDDVRSDIEAALRSQGIEPLARGVRA